ncbi:hypothetical protein BHE74_00040128 [Ensete ventricosum]|nr:hypothetical protein BHE74_00040128 [Ensete ventricosum]
MAMTFKIIIIPTSSTARRFFFCLLLFFLSLTTMVFVDGCELTLIDLGGVMTGDGGDAGEGVPELVHGDVVEEDEQVRGVQDRREVEGDDGGQGGQAGRRL